MTNDIVFDGQMNTHRRTEDGKAAIIFDGKYYVSALRFITGTKKNYQHVRLKELWWNSMLWNVFTGFSE